MLFAKGDPPAGGAEIGEVIIATAMGLVATAAVVGPIVGYRAGRFPALGRLADFAGRTSGLPGWAALPLAVQGGSLILAVFGMYWDISLHIDNGRDPGPLANPAHHFILVGLLGVMAAGVLAMALPQKPIRSSVHIPGVGWDAPAGAIMIAACGALSLTAFPLDDVWHRIFGQDVTLWSPTHLMLITGASLSTFGGLALYREALEEAAEPEVVPERAGWLLAPLAGAMLIGLNTFMGEFDFAVPQFRLDAHPVGLMMASGIALVTARLVIGPWGALATVGFFLIIRGGLTLLVGPVLGQTEPHFPLYLVEAIAVEVVALALIRGGVSLANRPVTFGALAGVAIGTFGLAAEWGWTQVWFVNPWTASMFPEAAILGFLMAVSAGVIGGFVGRALTLRGTRLAAAPGWVLPAAAVVAVGVAVYVIPISSGDGRTSAELELTDAKPTPQREVEARISLDPPDAADDARWFQVTAWQGEEGASIVSELDETSPGVYETEEPIPVHGTWKAILRLHVDADVLGLPIFLPEDTAIPAPEVPAEPSFTREFILDKQNLQREQKDDVSPVLTTFSYAGVLAIVILLVGCIYWGLRRIRIRLGAGEGPSPPPARGEAVVPTEAPRPAT
jgi:hypothetical protein